MTNIHIHNIRTQARIASFLIKGVVFLRFSTILGFENWFPSGCLEEISIFKIIMIDDVTYSGQSSNLHGKSNLFY